MNKLDNALPLPADAMNAPTTGHAPSERTKSERAGPRNRRATAVRWLRLSHGWIGLWGAVLGLIFGVSGIWLNHRAVLKLPPIAQQRSNTQLALPDPPPADAQALADWLQTALQLDAPAASIKTEEAKPLPWLQGEKKKGPRARRDEQPDAPPPADEADAKNARAPTLMQPERWTINFGGPHSTIQAELWSGNRSVSIRRTDNGVLGTMMNMHKGTGMSIGWILLVDTLAGSIIFLSLSGLALWVLTTKRRTVGYVIFGSVLALTIGLFAARL